MDTMSQMLEDYRNGERGLPSYDELCGLVGSTAVIPFNTEDTQILNFLDDNIDCIIFLSTGQNIDLNETDLRTGVRKVF